MCEKTQQVCDHLRWNIIGYWLGVKIGSRFFSIPSGLFRCNKKINKIYSYVKKKVKDTALDSTVPTGGADLRFLALQPGSAMGGRGPAILCFIHMQSRKTMNI